jgi:asparagine synthase (glutamine-hydrolysing)
MCGICGIVAADPRAIVEPETVRRMTEVVRHRGPDDAGDYVNERVGLGACRLSIIDLTGGRQPIHNERGNIHVVFNGELYNYRSLRARLESCGHGFYTNSDTEVVVHAYEQFGSGCLDLFRGMFAFALWDAEPESLLLAVDRFGIKPLYYSVSEDGLVFGSELACLLESGRLQRELDYDSLAEYFTLGYVPAPATIFRAARKLEPGTFLRWSPRRDVVTEEYWDLPSPSRSERSPRDMTRRQLRRLLKEAVEYHLVSDVPVGAFLSGGVDSSAVVALMSEVSPDPVRTFSIGFRDRAHDELAAARLVADAFRTDHRELVIEPESVDLLPRLVAHFQEPFADPSALPTYFLSKLARESVKVALSGDGGDELFVGYTTYRGVELARVAQRLPKVARRALAGLPGRLPRTGVSEWNDRRDLWSKRAADSVLPPDAAYRSKLTVGGLSLLSPLLSRELRRLLAAHDPFRAVNDALARPQAGEEALARVVYAGLKVPLPGRMLVKVDRMSMANSLEVRVPLLDHALAEFVAAVPVRDRFPFWRLKALLKDTMADVLPPAILRRPKHGFTVPLTAWFRGDLVGFAAGTLLSAEAIGRGFFDRNALERFLRTHERADRNLADAIWLLLNFELWCRWARL